MSHWTCERVRCPTPGRRAEARRPPNGLDGEAELSQLSVKGRIWSVCVSSSRRLTGGCSGPLS
jgi:hypothetical protein